MQKEKDAQLAFCKPTEYMQNSIPVQQPIHVTK